MKNESVDVLVIGGGLSGLLAAAALEGQGHSVMLVEGAPQLGGSARDQGLKALPFSPAAEVGLHWLGSLLGAEIEVSAQDPDPVTFEKGQFLPFVGFGADAPKETDEISQYTRGPWLEPSLPVKSWIGKLRDRFHGKLLLKTTVTKLIVAGNSLREVQLNGEKTVRPKHVVFTGNPQDLQTLLSENNLPAKWVQRCSRAKLFTSVGVDITFNREISDRKNLHVLMGGGEDAHVVLGRFEPSTAVLQTSRWLCLVPADDDGEESSGAAVREVRRQLRRAYPASLDSIETEKIHVTSRSHGSLWSKDERPGPLQPLQNLWLSTSLLHQERGLVGTLATSARVIPELLECLRKETPQGVEKSRESVVSQGLSDLPL